MHAARGNAQKNIVLVIVALVILGAAGAIAYSSMSERMALAAHQATLDKGNQWRIKTSQTLSREPQKFNGVTLLVEPNEWKANVKVTMTVGGRVTSQQNLDNLRAIIEADPCPVEVVWDVRVVAPGK